MINTIKKLWKWLNRKWTNYSDIVQKRIVYAEQVELLMNKNKKPRSYTEATDVVYMTCNMKTLKKLVNMIPVKYGKYDANVHDCDDFAREFWALTKRLFPYLPIGYCHVETPQGRHAANFVIYENNVGGLSYTFIEPQTGKITFRQWTPYLQIV